jgi:hypothetical protein
MLIRYSILAAMSLEGVIHLDTPLLGMNLPISYESDATSWPLPHSVLVMDNARILQRVYRRLGYRKTIGLKLTIRIGHRRQWLGILGLEMWVLMHTWRVRKPRWIGAIGGPRGVW